MRFRYFPSAFASLRCAVRGGRPSDDPAATFDPPRAPAGGRVAANGSRPCGFASGLRALRPPCAARAAVNHGSRRSDRVMRRGLSLARRSATRVLSDPHATGPNLASSLAGPTTLLGFFHPSQCSPFAGPGVCDAYLARPFQLPPCVSAVHPHLPLSNASRPADFYGCRSRESELLPRSELLESDRLRDESTGSWVLLPLTSRAGRASSDALRPTNPAMGFWSLLSGLPDAFSQHAAARLGHRVLAHWRTTVCRSRFHWLPSALGFCARLKQEMHERRVLWSSNTGPIDLLSVARRAFLNPLAVETFRILRQVTSLPSPALQRLEQTVPGRSERSRSCSIGQRERAPVSDRLPV